MVVLEAEATVTDRYQTTVPAPVRKALHLKRHDKIVYKVADDGKVFLERAGAEEKEDPVLGKFLNFLARDIAAGSGAVRPVTPELVSRINALVGDVKVDLYAALSADDE